MNTPNNFSNKEKLNNFPNKNQEKISKNSTNIKRSEEIGTLRIQERGVKRVKKKELKSNFFLFMNETRALFI